jgi:predicted SnoaL-like aldol condensation-catalyzing enzyme
MALIIGTSKDDKSDVRVQFNAEAQCNKGITTMTTEANKAIVRRFYEEVFNQRNVDAIAEVMGDKFINNDPTPVAARDRESMKQFIKTITKVFPDHHHAIEESNRRGR